MGTNSIKRYMNKEEIISNIKLLLAADRENKNIFVVVEGGDDIKFLKKFFSENVIIFESYSGKQGLEEIIETQDNTKVIGIRDKDYCLQPNNKRIFFYDRCCLEMMIIENCNSFNSIFCEFYQGPMDSDELKNHILSELYKLSILRKYNEENKKGINFKGLSFSDLIDKENKLNERVLKAYIEKKNSTIAIDFSWNEVISNNLSISNLLDITNGHDFISFFKVLCDVDNKDNVKPREISSTLRGTYRDDDFIKTKLYENIKNSFENKEIFSCQEI